MGGAVPSLRPDKIAYVAEITHSFRLLTQRIEDANTNSVGTNRHPTTTLGQQLDVELASIRAFIRHLGHQLSKGMVLESCGAPPVNDEDVLSDLASNLDLSGRKKTKPISIPSVTHSGKHIEVTDESIIQLIQEVINASNSWTMLAESTDRWYSSLGLKNGKDMENPFGPSIEAITRIAETEHMFSQRSGPTA